MALVSDIAVRNMLSSSASWPGSTCRSNPGCFVICGVRPASREITTDKPCPIQFIPPYLVYALPCTLTSRQVYAQRIAALLYSEKHKYVQVLPFSRMFQPPVNISRKWRAILPPTATRLTTCLQRILLYRILLLGFPPLRMGLDYTSILLLPRDTLENAISL